MNKSNFCEIRNTKGNMKKLILFLILGLLFCGVLQAGKTNKKSSKRIQKNRAKIGDSRRFFPCNHPIPAPAMAAKAGIAPKMRVYVGAPSVRMTGSSMKPAQLMKMMEDGRFAFHTVTPAPNQKKKDNKISKIGRVGKLWRTMGSL